MIIFLSRLLIPLIYALGSKLLNLKEVFLREILFYIVCVGGGDIDMRKFVWDNLFRRKRVLV